ncbi:hypothetical protein BC939DRAFT_453553 [Gamsiella multidivaricata]|uniref:uncharacterized protein n=1 Tax=Gamsiella multidivaricata TaxID=101098 RepID=UPI00221FBE8F|nr:uncharacterized protein BC939DRAFT_453553 [Gamsiella multidivaricata]KAI7822526.1 hypothetical protein BC939DRAFT_453553 [Gamsiella multidivaricata]
MTSKEATTSTTLASEADDDAKLMQQLQDELKNAAIEDDDDMSASSISSSQTTGIKMQANMLTAAEQEIADQRMLHGVKIFFENEFIEAQRIFASRDQVDPIYALGSGAMAFMKGGASRDRQLTSLHFCVTNIDFPFPPFQHA